MTHAYNQGKFKYVGSIGRVGMFFSLLHGCQIMPCKKDVKKAWKIFIVLVLKYLNAAISWELDFGAVVKNCGVLP
jgi:hypothetical protein